MKKTLSIVFSFFLLGSAAGQNLNIDSLLKVAMSSKARAAVIINPNRDSMMRLIPLTEAPSDRITLIYNIIERSGSLNPKDAFYYHKKILEITRKNHDDVGEAIILAELGYLVSVNGDNPEGLKIILSALKLAEKSGNARAMGIVYDNLGVCTENNSAVRKSYYQKALHFSQAGGDDEFVCFELHNLSGVYQQEKRKDSMEYYFKKAFELSVKKNLQVPLPANLLIFASNQTTTSNQLKYLKLALQMPYTRLDAQNGTNTLYGIARVYKKEGKIDSAIFYAKKAYQTSLTGSFINRITPTKFLANMYYDQHNADSALKYTIIYHSQRDSVSSDNKLVRAQAMGFSEQQKIQEAEAQKKEFQNRLWSYFLAAVILFLLVLAFIFWRNNRQKQKANYLLKEQKEEIETQRDSLGQALEELKITQTQLVQSEKMASLGELTAGIAHEIQNPLNFVNNFSEVNQEMIDELETELKAGNVADALALAVQIKGNEEKITYHGKRADAIVRGMLQHSRVSSANKEPTDINKLADEYLRLAYHGLRAKDKSFNADLVTNFAADLPLINIVPQDIGRVLLNILNNAFYAVQLKQKSAPGDFKPEVEISTTRTDGKVQVSIKDNGDGIPANIKDKILQPFFTTKPTGQGTGLGLSLSYDIVVKAHQGQLEIDSKEGEFTKITVTLPTG